MNAKQWLAAFAQELGTAPPTTDEFRTLLELAAEAAHASERVAAPVACWVAAKAGASPERALQAAQALGGGDGHGG